MADPVADRLGDRLRLLVDLLQHERLEAALLGAFEIPVELDGLVLDRRPVRAREDDRVGRDRHDVAVVREVDPRGSREKRCGVRGEEVLAVADPDDERRLQPRCDEQVGMVGVDDDEREVALQLGEGPGNRLDEVAGVVALDQVRDRLGVGLRGEHVAVGGEALAAARGSSRRCR